MADETQGKLDLSVICHVGPGTGGGEMFRRYWLAISRTEDLKDPVGQDVTRRTAAAQENRERERGVVVRARYMAAGEDHHHRRRADCEWRHVAGAGRDHRESDRRNKKKSTDELGQIFSHDARS